MPVSFRLYHHPFDPPSRRVRLALGEKKIQFETVIEKPWDPQPEYLAVSPAGDVPTLHLSDGKEELYLSEATSICEYLEETQKEKCLLPGTEEERAEIRRLIHWFEHKMYLECTSLIVGEKAIKRLQGGGQPNSVMLRAAYHNIKGHLEYISWLTERRNWIAGNEITLADLAAAAQISLIDYLNDVPWDNYPNTKDWYARIKSRPSFRQLLGDSIAGLRPSKQYANLDF